MSILYYFKDCPTCKNHNRNMVRQAALHNDVKIDERYIIALPDVWGEEAEYLAEKGAVLPFLYNTDTSEILNVDHTSDDMADRIKDFISSKQ